MRFVHDPFSASRRSRTALWLLLFSATAEACAAPAEDRDPTPTSTAGAPATQPPPGGTPPPAGGSTATPAPVGGGDAQPSGTAGTTATPPSGGSGGSAPTAGSSGTPIGTETPGTSEWTMMGYDLGSTYFNKAERVLTKENAATLTEIWTADMVANVYGAPLQIGDTIYASGPSQVRAYEAATGTEKWRAMVGTTGSIAFDQGTIYLNDTGGKIVAVDAADGTIKWSKQPDTQRADGSSSAIVAGDVVLVGGSSGGVELGGGSFRGYLAALDKMTGDVRWVTHTVPEGANGASIWSSASADLALGRAYGSTGNNYGTPATDTSDAIIAFDLATGEITWKNQRVENDTFRGFGGNGPDHDFGANPVLYETMVGGVMTQLISAGAKSGSAHAVRRDDGTLVWTRSLGPGTANGSQGIFVNSTWSGKLMIFACNEGGTSATLYGLDGATGDIVWMRSLSGLVWGRISVANGVGFVGTGEVLEVFDADTGAVIKSIPSKGGTVAGTISIANGRVAFGEGLSWNSGKRGQMLTVLAVQ